MRGRIFILTVEMDGITCIPQIYLVRINIHLHVCVACHNLHPYSKIKILFSTWYLHSQIVIYMCILLLGSVFDQPSKIENRPKSARFGPIRISLASDKDANFFLF